jgi:hypothetical protein
MYVRSKETKKSPGRDKCRKCFSVSHVMVKLEQ